MKRYPALFLTLSLFWAALTGCSTSSTVSAPTENLPTLRLGVYLPPEDSASEAVLIGAQYAQMLRPSVTVAGTSYHVELVYPRAKDAECAAQELAGRNCTAVFGGTGWQDCADGGATFRDAALPALCLATANPRITQNNDYLFRYAVSAQEQGTFLAQWAAEHNLLTAVTLNCIGEDYTMELVNSFTHTLERQGGTIAAALTYKPDQTDFSEVLEAIQDSGAQVVCAPTSLSQGVALLNQAAELGLNLQWLSGDRWESTSLIQNTGKAAKGIVLSTAYGTGGNKEFDQWAVNALPDEAARSSAALGYDCYNLLLDAIVSVGTLDGDACRRTLLQTQTDNPLCGPVSFDVHGDAVREKGCLVKVEKDTFQLIPQ